MLDDKETRRWLALTVLQWLVAIAILALVFAAGRAMAQAVPLYVHEEDGVSIRLMPGPCVEPYSLAFFAMVPQYAERAKAIESDWRMRDGSVRAFPGCWLELSAAEAGAGEAIFVLIFSDGERYALPKRQFGKRKGQVGA